MGCCCCCKGSSKTPEDSRPENIPFSKEMKRRCHDVFWLILFIAFVAGMIVVAAFAIKEGDLSRLDHGTDMYGAVCGEDYRWNKSYHVDRRSIPYLYWPDPLNLSVQLCVAACPTSNDTIGFSDIVTIFKQNMGTADSSEISHSLGKLECMYNVTPSVDAVINNLCWPKYPTYEMLGRCVPDVFDAAMIDAVLTDFFRNASAYQNSTIDWKNPVSIVDAAKGVIGQINARQLFMRVIHDIAAAWWVFLIMTFAAFIVGFLWLIFLRIFAGVIVWAAIIAGMLGLTALTIFVWVESRTALHKLPNDHDLQFSDDVVMAEFLSYATNVLLVVDTIVVILVILVARRIRLAVGIVKEASKAVKSLPCLVFGIPIWTFAALAVFFLWWIGIGVMLATAGLKPGLETKSVLSISLPQRALQYAAIYHLFGFYWIVEFILAVSKITSAGSVAEWYWKKGDTAKCSAATSFVRVLRYHLGSAALGSLIIAIVSMMRTALDYYDAKRKKRLLKNPLPPGVTDSVFCAIRCCLCMFERCLRYLTKNAYVVLAITGKSFCASGREAIETLAKNPVRVSILQIVSGFFLMLTRIAIAAVTALIAGIILAHDSSLMYWYIPTAIVFAIGFCVGCIFTEVYDMAIQTILFSFCHDESIIGEAHSIALREFMSSEKKKADKEARIAAAPAPDIEAGKHKEIELQNSSAPLAPATGGASGALPSYEQVAAGAAAAPPTYPAYPSYPSSVPQN